MKYVGYILLALSMTLSVAGCANKQLLSDQAVQQQYPSISTLGKSLETARNLDVDVLSPELFKTATEQYEKAIVQAKSEQQDATTIAQNGLHTLEKANTNATLARDVLEEVLKARNKAIAARAPTINTVAYSQAEDELLSLTTLIEEGKISKAKAHRSEVIALYSSIELATLKDNIVEQAKKAIDHAKKNDVDDFAPKTLKLAEEEYALALSTLDANRLSTEKSALHAQRSLWHAQRATQIMDTIVNFKNSDFNEEDKVLWYQEQLSRVVEPVETSVPYNQPNKVVVKKLTADIQSVVNDNQQNAQALAAIKQEKNQLAEESMKALQKVEAISASEKQRQKALNAKFDFVQALFSAKEAEVYRQKDNVLIRAFGFSFAPGGSEIEAKNFALMNKIIESINQFPDAKVVVSGHTDNRGADELNINLSQARADKVSAFINQVGNIGGDRIDAIGFGKAKPVANNDSDEGRAANRRVEILIVNNNQS